MSEQMIGIRSEMHNVTAVCRIHRVEETNPQLQVAKSKPSHLYVSVYRTIGERPSRATVRQRPVPPLLASQERTRDLPTLDAPFNFSFNGFMMVLLRLVLAFR